MAVYNGAHTQSDSAYKVLSGAMMFIYDYSRGKNVLTMQKRAIKLTCIANDDNHADRLLSTANTM